MFFIRMMVHTDVPGDPQLETVVSGKDLAEVWKRAARNFVTTRKSAADNAAFEEGVKKFKEPKIVVPDRKLVLVK